MQVDEYIQGIPDERKKRFLEIVRAIRALYPAAGESMKYRMPTYETDTGWVAVANQKSYISLYTCSAEHIEPFKVNHPGIRTGKGCINFRNRDAIPVKDLEQVVISAMESRAPLTIREHTS